MTLSELIELLTGMETVPGEVDGLSELDHGLQCAHELSRLRPDDAELQVAGLVHDIGHGFASDEQHGAAGGERVRALLGDRVAALVEMHVPAKRYLVTTDPGYVSALTGVSIESLAAQGGRLSPEEASSFASSEYAEDAVLLRRADDAAKVPGRTVPPLDHWLPMLSEVAR
ncbi:MAG: HD domain-containing protein [Acidimicrobiales bacterium]